MNKYRVYSKDGRVVRCETSALEYNGEWLGACNVTLSVSSPTPIDFEIGDYVEYRGERFTINYDPTELKQASRDSYGEAFKYENIVFNSYSDELTRCMFLDYVKSDNMVHYSSLPVFSFYAEDITYLAERIQVNLDRIYTGDDKWVVEVHPEYVNVTNRNISVSSVHVWDALALVKSEFDANFIIRGRKIIIGTEGIAVGKLFSYGKGNGLYSIQKTAESDQAIVTRLRAYGSVKNMPLSYYKDVTTKCFFPKHAVSGISDSRLTLDTTADITKCFTTRWEGEANNVYRVKIQIGNVTAIAKAYVYDNPKVTLDVNTDTGNTSAAVKAIVDAYRANSERVELVSGVDKSQYPLAYVESSPMPNNMAISNLMLPSFPNESLDPYLDSANIDELGIREGTIFFDGSGDLEEIYPTLEGMTAEELKAAGIAVESSGALDEVLMAEQVADDGTPNGSNEARQATFTITIKDIGFDINDYASDNAVIAMTTGMCGGREFAIEQCERVSGGYQLTCSRVKDETLGLYFPYNYYNIAAGDKFVLLNIDMPDVYVKAASERLLTAATEWLSKNDYTRYVYEPKVDEIFMARQHAEALATGGVSIHDTIKEGDLMLFEDADLGVDGSIIINSLTIKENGDGVPTYEVVLRADKAVGTIQKIQNQLDSIVKHGVSGGGYNAQQIQSFVRTFGEKYFLRKDKSDSTSYLQKFLGGIEVGEFLKGSNGIGMYQDSTGNWHIETDYLDVRFKFSATEVEIQKTSHIGGKVINTAASMMVVNVIETSNGYICYMNTTDDAGNTIYNTFEVGDQAYCETFNLDKQANGKMGNHFFWRLVTEVGTNYIILSKSDCAEQSDAPLSGDEIVLLGNRTNAERQGAIVQASAGSGSPYIRIYDKIKSYTLPKPKINLSPEGTEISADSIVLQSTGNNMEDEVGSLINITNTLSRELDGSFYVWQGEDNTIPTLENEPAVNWITDEIKQEHIDDFYITTDGFCYQFAYDEATNTYSWKIVTDQYLIKFVEQIGEKRRVFVDTPTDNDVYDIGDTWVNATYKDEELGVDYSNDVLVCIQAKDKGEAFNIVHWRKNSKYTDDTVANLVKKELEDFSGEYEKTIPLLQLQIDSKAETWYQDSDPKDGEGWGEDAKHVGDLWYKESTGETFYFDGTKWNEQNIPVAVFDKFDAKASIYVAKPSKYKANDMWILESTFALKGGAKYNKGTIVFANTDSDSFDASHWEKYDSYTDDSSLNNFINNQYTPFANDISKQIDKKAETWYQDADPRTSSSWGKDEERIGDMWCTTAGKTQIWNGTKWMQQGIPDDVFDTIDGKSSIFVEKPEHGYKARDMWILKEDYILFDSYSKGTIVIAVHDMVDDIFVDSDWVRFDSYASEKEVVNIKDGLQSLANKVNSEFAGSFYIWQGDDNTIPTLNNKPAVDWTDDNMRQAHVDDFYISADGVVYQFRNTNGVFSWVTVDDKYIIAYIEQMRSQLLKTGIDIEENVITVTAGQFKVQDRLGNPIAIFEVDTTTGLPTIKGEYLHVNYVNIANKKILLNSDGSGQLAGGNIAWDADGNTVYNGASRTKWKTLTYGVIYRSENVDVFGFNGSAVYNDRIKLEGLMGAELLIAWGDNADGREIEIFNKAGMKAADVKIIVPSGYKIIVSPTEIYEGGSEFMLRVGYIYYMTGMSDAWIVRQAIKIQNV